MSKIEEKVEKLISGPINDLQYELYDIEYVKEGKDYFLRIYIDSPKGIDLNDCEKVSNYITDLLDEENYIKDQYFLEVSSPGVERILRKDKHLKDNIGKNVQINLFKPINGKKQYTGLLTDFDNSYVIIENKERINLDRKNISQIKTIYNW